MQKVFKIHNNMQKSMVELSSNATYNLLYEYLIPCKNVKLPESVTFKVATGKKKYDLIRLFQSGEFFFSQKFIDVLSQIVDMSKYCYPIKIEDVEEQYYVIYNLPEHSFLNRENALFDDEPCFYCGKELCSPLSSITNTRCFVVSEEIKNLLIKNKISNIYFEDSYICPEEEYLEWKKNHATNA